MLVPGSSLRSHILYLFIGPARASPLSRAKALSTLSVVVVELAFLLSSRSRPRVRVSSVSAPATPRAALALLITCLGDQRPSPRQALRTTPNDEVYDAKYSCIPLGSTLGSSANTRTRTRIC